MDINLGPLARPLNEQVEALPEDEAKRLDAHRQAINRLRIHGILTRAEATRAEQRLLREIVAALHKEGASDG